MTATSSSFGGRSDYGALRAKPYAQQLIISGTDQPGGTIVIVEDSWHKKAISAVVPLTKLPKGWDGYKGAAVSHQTAMFALEVLEALMIEGSRLPSFVPTASGALQLEWHTRDFDFEILIRAPYVGEYSFHNVISGHEDEGEIEADLSPLISYASQL